MNQVKYNRLRFLGYTGTNPEMERAYYLANGGTGSTLNEARYTFLASKGFSVGALNDRFVAYTKSLGYTGGINDLEYKFWENATNGGGGGAPVLSSPTGTQTGATTASTSVTTNTADGTLYTIVSTSSTPPSVAQIQAGQQAGGTAAAYAANQVITTTGVKSFSATGLTANTVYYAYFQHRNAALQDSAVVSSASFTTAAAPAGNTLVMLNFDGANGATTTTDSSSYGRTVTFKPSTTLSNSQSLSGGTSLLVGNTNGGITIPNSSSLDLGSDDFTIEMFIRPTSDFNYPSVIEYRNTGAHGGWVLFVDNNGSDTYLRFIASSNGSSANIVNLGDPLKPYTASTWQHIAVCRQSGVFSLFMAGNRIASIAGAGSIYSDTNQILRIGNNNTGQSLVGFMEDVRIVKGQALYSGATYTVPASPLSVI